MSPALREVVVIQSLSVTSGERLGNRGVGVAVAVIDPNRQPRGGLHKSYLGGQAGKGLVKEIMILIRCLCRAGFGAQKSVSPRAAFCRPLMRPLSTSDLV